MERLRADELPAYTVARDVACCPPCPDQYGCARCKGTGRVPLDPLDLLRVLTFLGVEEAREIVGGGYDRGCDYYMDDDGPHPESCPIRAWLHALSRLLAKLPPHRLEVECANCRHGVVSLGPRCRRCRVTDTPAERWLLADAALAVAWECLRAEERSACVVYDLEAGHYRYTDTDSMSLAPSWSAFLDPVRNALLAGQAWVEEPTPERLVAWSRSVSGTPRWVPAPVWESGFYADRGAQAATILGAARVREVVTASLLGRIL